MTEKESTTRVEGVEAMRLVTFMVTDLTEASKEHGKDVTALADKNKKKLTQSALRLMKLGIFENHEEPISMDMTLEEAFARTNKIKILDSGNPVTNLDFWLTMHGQVLMEIFEVPPADSHTPPKKHFKEVSDLEYVVLYDPLVNAIKELSLEALPKNS